MPVLNSISLIKIFLNIQTSPIFSSGYGKIAAFTLKTDSHIYATSSIHVIFSTI